MCAGPGSAAADAGRAARRRTTRRDDTPAPRSTCARPRRRARAHRSSATRCHLRYGRALRWRRICAPGHPGKLRTEFKEITLCCKMLLVHDHIGQWWYRRATSSYKWRRSSRARTTLIGARAARSRSFSRPPRCRRLRETPRHIMIWPSNLIFVGFPFSIKILVDQVFLWLK